jgi:hypothetical protein
LQPLHISTDFIIKAFQSIKSLPVLNTRRCDHTSPAGMAKLEKHTGSVVKVLKHPLSLFLRHGLPFERLDLCSRHHWVWDYLIVHLPSMHQTLCIGKIANLCLEKMTSWRQFMIWIGKEWWVLSSLVSKWMRDCEIWSDCCWITHEEHKKSPTLQDGTTKTRMFYQLYPHPINNQFPKGVHLSFNLA